MCIRDRNKIKKKRYEEIYHLYSKFYRSGFIANRLLQMCIRDRSSSTAQLSSKEIDYSRALLQTETKEVGKQKVQTVSYTHLLHTTKNI